MWPEVELAREEKRHELVLSGPHISKLIAKEEGLNPIIFTLSSLNYLNISETVLQDLPQDIGKLVNLQDLVLHSNKLTSIPQEIGKLDKLKTLDLSRNGLNEIPDFFQNLVHLTSLQLSGNNLKDFPVLTGNVRLSVLDLSRNKLTKFPDVCRKELANLAELKLSGNEIEEIPVKINELTLKLLDLSSNKLKTPPGELADCTKLKDLNLKSNPIKDRRLLKLIDQCRTKQVLDYIRTNFAKTSTKQEPEKKSKKKTSESSDEDVEPKHVINLKPPPEDFSVVFDDSVNEVRKFIACCLIKNVQFNEETFKKFIQSQNKLHDGICNKRNDGTIATHDFNKFTSGGLKYTTASPKELQIQPLNRQTTLTGSELFLKLQNEANLLRKEKKRSTYSGIHKFLYLLEGKSLYACLQDSNGKVVSFPPITNSEISKIEVTTSNIFLEVTSTLSQNFCKTVVMALLKDLITILDQDLDLQQINIVDKNNKVKLNFPKKNDLKFEPSDGIKVVGF